MGSILVQTARHRSQFCFEPLFLSILLLLSEQCPTATPQHQCWQNDKQFWNPLLLSLKPLLCLFFSYFILLKILIFLKHLCFSLLFSRKVAKTLSFSISNTSFFALLRSPSFGGSLSRSIAGLGRL